MNFQEASQLAAKKAQESGTPMTGNESVADIWNLAGNPQPNPSQDPNLVKDPTKIYDVFGNVAGDKLPPTNPNVSNQGGLANLANVAGIDLTGFSSNVSTEDLISSAQGIETQRRETSEAAAAAQATLISSQYDRAIKNVREQMEQELSGTTAIGARRAGLGASTTLQANLEQVRRTADQRIGDLERQRADAVARNDMALAATLDASLGREQNQINTIYKDAWQMKVDIFGIQSDLFRNQLAQTQMDWSVVSKLKKGDTWTSPSTGVVYTGIEEPEQFFGSSDIVNLMKALPIGQTQEITDPTTGDIWTINGIGQPDINTKVFTSIDAQGNMHIISLDQTTNKVEELAIVRGAGKPTTSIEGYAPTTEMKEYQYAVSQGYEGTFLEYKNDVIKAKPVLTQTQLNKLGQAGVPENIALHIQQNLNVGATLEEIRTGLATDLGDQGLAFNYLDRFMESVQTGQADDLFSLLQELSGD